MAPYIGVAIFVLITIVQAQELTSAKLLCPHICLKSGTLTGNRVAGEEVTLKCDEGYHVIGASKLNCENDGTWSGSVPKCEKDVACKGITGVEFGRTVHSTDANKPGGTVDFTCNNNYKLQGQARLTCQNDGTWDHPVPKCVDQKCRTIRHLLHGRITEQNTLPGKSVKFTCDAEFKLTGSDTLICGGNGEWDGKLPVCEENRCDHISYIEHGYIENYDDLVGSTVIVVCDVGYTPDGATNLTCLTNKRWSSPVPICVRDQTATGLERTCPYLNIKNGVYKGKRSLKSRLIASCDKGYKLQGVKKLKCSRKTEKWSKQSYPKCVVNQCSPVDFIANAKITRRSSDPITPGKTLKVKCHKDYFRDGDEVMTCQDDLTWSHFPRCIQNCPHVQYFEHGTARGYSNQRTGGRVRFECNAGHALNGTRQVKCQKNAQWSSEFPTCEPKKTCDVACLQHGEFTERTSRKKKTVHYMCDEGYILHGAVKRECRDGAWDKDPPRCEVYTNDGDPACKSKPVDIYFVVDISKSIKADELEEERNAIRLLIKSFDFSTTRVGLIKYNKVVKTEFNLSTYTDKAQLNRRLILTRPTQYDLGTLTHLGMNKMMSNFEEEKVEGRRRISILMSDGKATRPIEKMIADLNKTDIMTIAIGVGEDADKEELRQIASGEGDENVYMTSDFSALQNIAKSIVTTACKNESNEDITDSIPTVAKEASLGVNKMKFKASAKKRPPECVNVSTAFYFVVDISKSISDKELEQERTCVNYMINSIDIGKGEGKSRVGLVKFHREAFTEFSLGKYTTRAELRKIKVLTRPDEYPGGTFTDLGMNMMMDNFAKETRSGENKVCILLTDGKSTCKAYQFEAMAKRLDDTDIKTIAIGVGNKVDREELKEIASGDGNANVYVSTNFDDLKTIISDVIKQACTSNITSVAE